MRKLRKLLMSLVLVVALVASFATPVLAADPVVTITMSALTIAITNSQDTWAIGPVEVDDVVYFSATGAQDDDYSQIENTGNVAVDIEIQGTDAEGGAYDWALQAAAGDKIYSLYANTELAPTVYDVEVKSSIYVDLIANLVVDDLHDWSLKFTAPTIFDAADTGANKTATVTLVASEHV